MCATHEQKYKWVKETARNANTYRRFLNVLEILDDLETTTFPEICMLTKMDFSARLAFWLFCTMLRESQLSPFSWDQVYSGDFPSSFCFNLSKKIWKSYQVRLAFLLLSFFYFLFFYKAFWVRLAIILIAGYLLRSQNNSFYFFFQK